MAASITIEIPGEPVAFARAGAHGKQRFTPAKQKAYMQTVQWCARTQLGPSLLLTGALRLRCQFVYEWPKSWPAKRLSEGGACWKTSRPDADNLLKLIKDSLTGIVYHDDSQIFHIEGIKLYGTRSHTVVTIWEGAGP